MTWKSPIVTGPSDACMSRSGHIIRTPGRLAHAPAVELRYLGEMAELDKFELANTYMALQSMELALIGAGVGGGIKHTSELKVLNYKKPCIAPMRPSGEMKSDMRRHDLISIIP